MDQKNKLLIKAVLLFIFGPGIALIILPSLINIDYGYSLEAANFFSYFSILFWAGGFFLIYKSVSNFAFIGYGTPAPSDPPKVLVDKDIYRFNRNPMYTGALLFMLGNLIWAQNIMLLYYLLFFIFLFNFYVFFYEEPKLKKKFGAPYFEYIKKVPRWLPKGGFK
jgi:protein-S-isoprenylcysteine O-methyltransferase Ste14